MAKTRARSRERQRARLAGTAPPILKVSAATVARKPISGQTAGSVWQKRKTRKSTQLMEHGRLRRKTQGRLMKQELVGVGPMMMDDSGVDSCEAWVLSVEGNNKPVEAEFLPLDSACEEHTCLWNFGEGGRDLGPSNVQLRSASGLSIPSGRKVMVSYDVLGPEDA